MPAFIVETVQFDFDGDNITNKEIPSVEVTLYGLFGGETNDLYNHFTVPILGKTTNLAIVRRVKAELGWCGIRCAVLDYGETIELEPKGLLQKAVIEPNYLND